MTAIRDLIKTAIQNEVLSETRKYGVWLDNIPILPDLEIPTGVKVGVGTWAGDYDLTFPVDFALIASHKEAMLEAGWDCTFENTTKEELGKRGSCKMIFRKECLGKNFERVELSYNIWKTGATCQRVVLETHTEEREVSIYEIVCNEGIAEETEEAKEE